MSRILAETPVVILAGGLGRRLQSVVSDRPKPLARIGDQPFLAVQMQLLRDQGARRFVLCVGYRSEQVREQFGDGSTLGVSIEYSEEGEQLLGTGGALKLAERFFAPRALVLNGDTYLAADYGKILESHARERARSGLVATVTLARLDDARRYGTVLLDDSGKFLTGFREKQETTDPVVGWLNAGAYVIEQELLDIAPPTAVCSLERDVFPAALAASCRMAAAISPRPFFDIGTPEDYVRFQNHYRELRSA